tara:strand:- start:540 stop:881 length:342 start_codon:yes stop_codon:yes gene_type:complete
MNKFDRTIISVSVSKSTREYFQKLDKLRPNHVSFSGMLGQAANEYVSNHAENAMTIDEFTNENMVMMPQFYSEINVWIKYIESLNPEELKKLQSRNAQIANMINKKVETYLQW